MSLQPFSREQWTAIDTLGKQVEQVLQQGEVGLMMGGEPTYISATNRDALHWRYEALGDDKQHLAEQLLRRLQARLIGPGCLLHNGLGKQYPGEVVPRWALGCFWRQDGVPLWSRAELLAPNTTSGQQEPSAAADFMTELAQCLAVPPEAILPAYEEKNPAIPAGYVLPLLTTTGDGQVRWQSCRWPLWSEGVPLLAGQSILALRLPFSELPPVEVLPTEAVLGLEAPPIRPQSVAPLAADYSIRLALVVQVRQGWVHVFMPPVQSPRSYADILTAIEATAEALDQPVVIEGYPPPANGGIMGFQITPDPGVLEVNIHPVGTWADLVHLHRTLDEEAIEIGLACEKFGEDGRWLGTGGGAHITLGGATPESSPLLRRPDLLRSFITYWQNHPSLSYLFAGQFIGETSQAPRVDEARHDSLYELELAFLAIAPGKHLPPVVLDALLSPFLQDSSGNSHRTTLCIDKLYPAHNPNLQWGLLEFRGFEMPPSTGIRLLQMLLVRAFVAWFWQQPYTPPLKRWGAELRDRWLLPHFLQADLQTVLTDLSQAGYAFQMAWFETFLERRFPILGQVSLDNPSRRLELKKALEPWPVLRDGGGTARPVDDSLERIQLCLTGAIGDAPIAGSLAARYTVLCNGYPVPMRSTGNPGEYVGAVRFRARSRLAEDIPLLAPHWPLHIQVIDTWQNQSLGGCLYQAAAPLAAAPTTWEEARSRLTQCFSPLPAAPISSPVPSLITHPETPFTLDLRLVSQYPKK